MDLNLVMYVEFTKKYNLSVKLIELGFYQNWIFGSGFQSDPG